MNLQLNKFSLPGINFFPCTSQFDLISCNILSGFRLVRSRRIQVWWRKHNGVQVGRPEQSDGERSDARLVSRGRNHRIEPTGKQQGIQGKKTSNVLQ